MDNPTDYPLLVLVLSFFAMALSGRAGVFIFNRSGHLEDDVRKDLDVILAATLTLLALVIGFTLSMAVSRYDQRKNLEEEEANAIGTEMLRADLLPAADAAKVRALLAKYLDQRILFYTARDGDQIRQINAATARLQSELWSAIQGPASAQPTTIIALAVAGMNDVLNSQGYTQAAWWNRIPTAAWMLLVAIAVGCNLLAGYGARKAKKEAVLLLVLPLLVSISFFLIADIDSPRFGIIRVIPQNLQSLAESMHVR